MLKTVKTYPRACKNVNISFQLNGFTWLWFAIIAQSILDSCCCLQPWYRGCLYKPQNKLKFENFVGLSYINYIKIVITALNNTKSFWTFDYLLSSTAGWSRGNSLQWYKWWLRRGMSKWLLILRWSHANTRTSVPRLNVSFNSLIRL